MTRPEPDAPPMPDDSGQSRPARTTPLRVAVDAMGGYNAPDEVVAAVAEASLQAPSTPRVHFTLVGDEQVLTDTLFELSHNPERIRIHHADRVAARAEPARRALDADGTTSIEEACRLVARGRADALVTAGHPGAAVVAGSRHLERIPGIGRAALASVYPTPRTRGPHDDRFALILDVGASIDSGPDDLVDFALMGSAYSRSVSGLEAPKVALLSTSAERTVGPTPVVEAAERLEDDERIHFDGTCEGQDIARGRADVVVCNGYVGNVTIKLLEGVAEAAVDMVRSAYEERIAWKVGLGLLSGGIRELKRMTDFEEYGGAPVLGFDHPLIVAHARSHQKAFANAVRLAIKNVKDGLPERIRTLASDVESGREEPS